MIPAYTLSPLANHLWQSTAVAALVGLLVLALQENQARVRYWLWMIASVKFLLPFSLLIAMGGYLRPAAATPMANPSVSVVLEQITEPFSRTTTDSKMALTAIDQPAQLLEPAVGDGKRLTIVLSGIWACGFVAVLFSWWRKWRTVRSTVRAATRVGVVGDVLLLSSPSQLEPGVFGISEPVLLLPEGITERLTAPQLSAIIAHEMTHVRRRDNLAAAFHMLVEALFWFNPIVWWIGGRLVEERERACDEAVLQAGNEAQVYAEGILNLCKLYFESPLACVSGVTGADLKKRIVRIVTRQVERKLDLSRKLLLSVAGLCAISSPVVFGLAKAAQSPSTDLAGIWQGTLHAPQKDLRTMLKITKGDGGAWKGQMFSIDQGGQAIPVASLTLQGSTVKYSIMMLDLSYEGKLSADGASITGTVTQAGKPLPLNFTRTAPEAAWAIPEPPARIAPMAPDANPTFEVATIKPSKPDAQGRGFRVNGRQFSTLNTSVISILGFAFGLQTKQIIGAPPWLDSDKFDIQAQPDADGAPNDKQWKAMVQKLLADRFKLTFHHELKELAVYAVVIGKNGPKLTKSQSEGSLPSLFFRGLGVLPGVNATMADFAGVMQGAVLDRPVVDKTGLSGRWDFMLKWTPDESQFGGLGIKVPPPADPANAPPDLFTAIQEQMGLKLEATKAPVDVIVIDHVEKPSEN